MLYAGILQEIFSTLIFSFSLFNYQISLNRQKIKDVHLWVNHCRVTKDHLRSFAA